MAQDLITNCLKFTREICSGITYLSGKAFVHRDLAARNIFVSKYKVCKVSHTSLSHIAYKSGELDGIMGMSLGQYGEMEENDGNEAGAITLLV